MKKGSLIALVLPFILLLGACDSNSNIDNSSSVNDSSTVNSTSESTIISSTIESSSSEEIIEQSTQEESSIEEVEKVENEESNAKSLTDNEINRRIIAWFAEGHTIKTVNGNQISVYPSAEIGWIDVAETKVFTTTIYVSAEEMWNVEVTEDGNVYVVRYSASYAPGSIFIDGTSVSNIFDITDEQLSQVREDVSKPYNP